MSHTIFTNTFVPHLISSKSKRAVAGMTKTSFNTVHTSDIMVLAAGDRLTR